MLISTIDDSLKIIHIDAIIPRSQEFNIRKLRPKKSCGKNKVNIKRQKLFNDNK